MSSPLNQAFTMRKYFHADVANLGQRSNGSTRLIVNVVSGYLKFFKEFISAEVLPPGGDWPLVDTNASRLWIDARARAKTHQGEVYVAYSGVVYFDGAMRVILDESRSDFVASDFADTLWFRNVKIETTDPRLKYLETSFLVGQGRWHVDEDGLAADYLVYQMLNA